MNVNNPYAQGGWFNPDNQNSINNGPWSPTSPPPPSIFGALPFSSEPKPETILQFVFTFESTILDSTVVGPRNRTYFHIANGQPREGTTLFRDAEGRNFAVIDWQQHPVVELRDLLERQAVSSWMPLSSDRTQRAMTARGRWYCWVPQGNTILLYTATHASTPPTPCGKLSRTDRVVTLELTANAVQVGLLEFCIVAAVLLQSGRRID
ncbi:hypothetical protein BDZ89DRAFT_1154387 [Hymenopellis radicata]|nr:hypothetical protein BDZ89DRAFT_1154387 [Hymenopellis radicata]